jgi:hypothetical protein
MPEIKRKHFQGALPLVSTLIVATVYLRYHYVIDVIAGPADGIGHRSGADGIQSAPSIRTTSAPGASWRRPKGLELKGCRSQPE